MATIRPKDWRNALNANSFGGTGVATDIQGGAPQGLTEMDLNNIRAGLAGQAEAGTNQALEGLGRSLGGDVSNPLFAMQAARLRAGGRAGASAASAQVGIQNTQNQQALEMQNRGLALSVEDQNLRKYLGDMSNSQFNATLANNQSQFGESLALDRRKFDESLAWEKKKYGDSQRSSSSSYSGGDPMQRLSEQREAERANERRQNLAMQQYGQADVFRDKAFEEDKRRFDMEYGLKQRALMSADSRSALEMAQSQRMGNLEYTAGLQELRSKYPSLFNIFSGEAGPNRAVTR